MKGPLTGRLLAGLGLLISLYLTAIHFTVAPLACPTGGVVNCDAVLGSPYATLGPVPVSVLGIVWFTGMLLLLRRPAARRIWAWLGGLTVVGLVYTELFLVGYVCLWCSSVHLIVLLLLLFSEAGWLDTTPADPSSSRSSQGGL